MTVTVTGELGDVEERLIGRFCPPLRPEDVQRLLVEAVVSFNDTRVRTYVSVLIERATTEQLRVAVAEAAGDVAPRMTPDTTVQPSRIDPPVLVGGV